MPELGRFGLAHGILSWARCRVWCREHDVPMLAPNWFKIRVGPYVRGERDKRNYFLLFQPGDAVTGLGRLAAIARSEARNIGPEWPDRPVPKTGPVLLKFRNAISGNDAKSFWQVRGHGAFLRRELLAITKPRYQPSPVPQPFIAIHVRMGDFRPVSESALIRGETNTRQPIEWYVDRLRALRASLGMALPAVVYSDGCSRDLAKLLAEPAIDRAPAQQSVTDLLQMGQAACVISSASGFSTWGAFLGQAPRLCFPGQMRIAVFNDPRREIESAFGDALPDGFVGAVHTRAWPPVSQARH